MYTNSAAIFRGDIAGVVEQAKDFEAGVRVGRDIRVVGFDDIVLARHSNPPLTTIRQDLQAGAKMLVDMVFRQIDGEICEPVQLEPELIVRATS